jgi:hypothetical protein
MRQVSMATRDELLAALTVRFGQALREDKVRILTEFVALYADGLPSQARRAATSRWRRRGSICAPSAAQAL